MATVPTNLRMDKDAWEAVKARAEEIADLGVRGDRHPQFRFNASDILHREIEKIRHETLEETMARYGIADPRAATR